jgi:hypothetical protein
VVQIREINVYRHLSTVKSNICGFYRIRLHVKVDNIRRFTLITTDMEKDKCINLFNLHSWACISKLTENYSLYVFF